VAQLAPNIAPSGRLANCRQLLAVVLRPPVISRRPEATSSPNWSPFSRHQQTVLRLSAGRPNTSRGPKVARLGPKTSAPCSPPQADRLFIGHFSPVSAPTWPELNLRPLCAPAKTGPFAGSRDAGRRGAPRGRGGSATRFAAVRATARATPPRARVARPQQRAGSRVRRRAGSLEEGK